jgi:hypothetical protein
MITKQSVKRRREQRELDKLFREICAENGGACVLHCSSNCSGIATEPHHKLGRGIGGKDVKENILPSCHACHRFVHDHPAAAYAAGLMLRRHEAPESIGGTRKVP